MVDLKLEVVVIPVTDVDRAKGFYTGLGWRLDADFPFDNGFRVVQFTPPGAACSVQFGSNITSAPPGSAQGAHGEHEKRLGHADEDWPDWYATYMAAEQTGAGLPT